MKDLSEEILAVVTATSVSLAIMPERELTFSESADKWSVKEILGHLIDSAANNHQRIVRAQLSGESIAISYSQRDWVKCQNYQQADLDVLLRLWLGYNQHLAYLIANFPPDKLDRKISTGSPDTITIELVMRDYLRHLKHHIAKMGF